MNRKNIFTGFVVLLFAVLLLAPILAQEKPVKDKKCSTETQQVCKDECKSNGCATMGKCGDKANCEKCKQNCGENCKKNCGENCKMAKCDASKSGSKCEKKCDTTTEKSENTINNGTEIK